MFARTYNGEIDWDEGCVTKEATMIKRYDLGQIRLGGQGNDIISGPGIVEREDGDYVRYEDYMRIIDAIGAGGVKGPLMRKELSDEAVEEIKAMADIRLVDGRAELSNVRVLIHAITRGITRSCVQSRDKLEVQ